MIPTGAPGAAGSDGGGARTVGSRAASIDDSILRGNGGGNGGGFRRSFATIVESPVVRPMPAGAAELAVAAPPLDDDDLPAPALRLAVSLVTASPARLEADSPENPGLN